jgi:hypothetical protein
LEAGAAKRAGNFSIAKRLSLDAADGEIFAPFSSEYILSAGASSFEQRELAEAFSLFDKALIVWQSSWLARLLEPRLGSVANYLKWACLHELGTPVEGLAFLYASAKTHWDRDEACKQWLQLLFEARQLNDERYMRLGLQGATSHCQSDDAELAYWKDLLR